MSSKMVGNFQMEPRLKHSKKKAIETRETDGGREWNHGTEVERVIMHSLSLFGTKVEQKATAITRTNREFGEIIVSEGLETTVADGAVLVGLVGEGPLRGTLQLKSMCYRFVVADKECVRIAWGRGLSSSDPRKHLLPTGGTPYCLEPRLKTVAGTTSGTMTREGASLLLSQRWLPAL